MISVITPSYGQLDWLRLCAASVADQEGLEVEHIVQDGGTGEISEATIQPAAGSTACKLRLYVEKDNGMYDAINRGLRRSRGEICAYLNCDEQYLPGALTKVATAFEQNPTTDVFLAGSLVVDGEGRYLCSRAALKPWLSHLRAGRMYNLTSSMFFRAKLFRERNVFFDAGLRIVGDMDWLRRVMESGARVDTLDFFTSTFSDLGTNLALSDAAESETGDTKSTASAFRGLASASVIAAHRIRRLLAGHYRQRPFDYSIYTLTEGGRRRTFHVEQPTGVWRNRL